MKYIKTLVGYIILIIFNAFFFGIGLYYLTSAVKKSSAGFSSADTGIWIAVTTSLICLVLCLFCCPVWNKSKETYLQNRDLIILNSLFHYLLNGSILFSIYFEPNLVAILFSLLITGIIITCSSLILSDLYSISNNKKEPYITIFYNTNTNNKPINNTWIPKENLYGYKTTSSQQNNLPKNTISSTISTDNNKDIVKDINNKNNADTPTKNNTNDDLKSRLSNLEKLKENGLITQTEYLKLKEHYIKKEIEK